MVSELGVIPSDNNPPIVASGRSGFKTLTDLVNPNGLGNLTAALQVQGGGVIVQVMIILIVHLLILSILLQPHN